MGCDIHGHIQRSSSPPDAEDKRWRTVAPLIGLVGRSYDAFGALWGVRNSVNIPPAFPSRGLPDGHLGLRLSREASYSGDTGLQQTDDETNPVIEAVDCHDFSWATAAELDAMDRSVKARFPDSRVSVLDEAKEPTGTKFAYARGHEERIEENKEALANGEAIPFETPSGEQRYLKQRQMTREEALDGSWLWLLDEFIPVLTERWGEENVRIVVWFDN